MEQINYIKNRVEENGNVLEDEEVYEATFDDEETALKYLESFCDCEFEKDIKQETHTVFTVTITRKKEDPKEWVEVVHKEYSFGGKKYLLTIQEK